MEEIRFSCPACSEVLEAPGDMSGMAIQCPTCQRQIKVPASANKNAPQKKVRTSKQSSSSVSDKEKPFIGVTKFQGTVIIILLLIGSGFPPFNWIRPATQWEYSVLFENDSQSLLNSQGAEGWEVVTARRARAAIGDDYGYEYILKRPKRF